MESMEEARRGPTLSERGRLTPINHKILAQMRRANKQLPEPKKSGVRPFQRLQYLVEMKARREQREVPQHFWQDREESVKGS